MCVGGGGGGGGGGYCYTKEHHCYLADLYE